MLLARMVTQWAEPKPDEIAITYGDRNWTWAQWNDRIRRVAGALRAAGIERGGRIAFLDKNNPACLEATFAAASIGAAMGILNCRFAGDELDFVINDCDARVLFVGAELVPNIEAIRDRLP